MVKRNLLKEALSETPEQTTNPTATNANEASCTPNKDRLRADEWVYWKKGERWFGVHPDLKDDGLTLTEWWDQLWIPEKPWPGLAIIHERNRRLPPPSDDALNQTAGLS